MSYLGHVASCTSRLSEQIRQVLQDDRQALTIGGDHSLSIGTIDGHVKVENEKYFCRKIDNLLSSLTATFRRKNKM